MSESAIVTVTRPITAAAGVFAPGHLGELTQYLPFELVDDVLAADQDGAASAAGAAVPGRGVLRARAGAVPAAGVCAGVGQADRRAGGSGAAEPVGEGAAGSAPPARPGAVQGAVRGRRRAVGPAAHARGALPRAAHRRLRWLQLAQGARHRPQPILAGPDPVPDGLRRLSHDPADDAGRDRHPRPARRRLGFRRPTETKPPWPGGCCRCCSPACWCCWTGASTPPPSSTELAGTGAKFLARSKSTRSPPVLAQLPDGSFLSDLDGLPCASSTPT